MSEAHSGFVESPDVQSLDSISKPTTTGNSFFESFLNSFFREKNIKWMLVVGAAIVFASSLMLITRNWPHWGNALKYGSILGYTAGIFLAAEVSRKRLALNATYKVLHSLTLLLLPITFLALRWLSAGTAAQASNGIEFAVLLLPALGLLWVASRRIIDHQLRGRQTTFLVSFCVLCVAGVLPPFVTPGSAFLFMAVCWAVMTIGVVKVNRHTFWLAEEHMLPRIFGFLPIAMLGLLFCVLVAAKAITAMPVQWIGFGIVMFAATVLLTARSVAGVFRQRTGDLVRPLPWSLAIPLFAGLVLTVVGLALSFSGFSYVSSTTYAVIPTAVVAAILMFCAAADTRHSGFVWAGLVCTTIAYQTCPTLFADLVQVLKDSTASAINRERVPVSLYGVTYLPLLGVLSIVARSFIDRDREVVFRPIRQFVTLMSISLFLISFTDIVSVFIVSLTNIVAFVSYAGFYRDRRYALPAVLALATASAVAVPAMNSMGLMNAPVAWSATVLAGLAVLLISTRLPDRIINSIPLSDGALLRYRDERGDLTQLSRFFQTRDGADREFVRLAGQLLAGLLAGHWICHALTQMREPLTAASLLQYVFLMIAFVVSNVRRPHYFSGLFFWGMAAFALVRWAVGLQLADVEVLNAATYLCTAVSLSCFLLLRWTRQITRTTTLNDLRRSLGFEGNVSELADVRNPGFGDSPIRLLHATVVPLVDLSLVVLACLAAPFHLYEVVLLHGRAIAGWETTGLLLSSTIVCVGWLLAATVVFRSRLAGIASTMVVPLFATSMIISAGIPIHPSWWPMVWAVAQGGVFVVSRLFMMRQLPTERTFISSIHSVSERWLNCLLLLSCLSFEFPFRLTAAICLGTLFLSDRRHLNRSRTTFYAIIANVQLLLFVAALSGYSGGIATLLDSSGRSAALPLQLLTVVLSSACFDRIREKLDVVICETWTAILRAVFVPLAGLLLIADQFSWGLQSVAVLALAIGAAADIAQAVRKKSETHVWSGFALLALSVFFLFIQGVISVGTGMSQFLMLGISVAALWAAWIGRQDLRYQILSRPSLHVGQLLPSFVAIFGVIRHFQGYGSLSPSLNALALMLGAGIYFQQAIVTRCRRFGVLAAVLMNAGLMLLWHSLDYHHLELYLVPVGISVLAFVELLKAELPRTSHDPLRYTGALTILVSPVFDVLGGSWTHMLVLLVLSTLLILVSIGLRIRVLVFAGSAFLLADLVAMVIHSAMGHPSLLWAFGIVLGAGVIGLAAFCENHREKLLTRLRLVTAELATWQ